ncbi:hypothetical protein HMI48_09730 [Acidithiobacillus ferrooxidans]|uniref:hypothetical protein n=1 Tax=Acidithiobacillus ferrooxidans TaxID=920 RepID=UPI001C06D370|nr:hypothetical protein [Acidithiobacillus ferrooxidans]MBU2772430.1 hypothetical protein [Acidithiobacillus ferrooxidans]MBU2774161.1 hypothetical protein [Acidithiobacillus ferrooxidans]
MRLDFNVLWVDDQPNYVASQSKSITQKMANEGFDFRPKLCETLDEVGAQISEDVFTDEIDLILVDWDLGNNEYGEDAIERVREIVRYKDVIFYSGQATVTELQQKAFDRKLEGVYCASRGELIDEVIGVFESLIKKVLDLDHTRGIVMGATSDIDDMIKTCLTLAHNKLDEEGKAKFIKDALELVDIQVVNIAKQGERLKSSPSMEALFKAHMLITSDHRLRMLASVLDMKEFEVHAAGAVTLKRYREHVVHDRNTLGHAVLVPEGKPNSVIDDTGRIVDIVQMRELRKLILNLRAEFRALLDAMRA